MRKTYYSLGLFVIIISIIGVYFYNIIYTNQIEKETKIYIKSTDNLSDVFNSLDSICNNIEHIKTVAALKKYNRIKPGMYILKKHTTTNQIINLLRSGQQTPVKVTFNNQNYIENLAGRLSHQIEADSVSILNSFKDIEFLKKVGLNNKNILNICMPYTYDCYWTITPDELRAKFLKVYHRFWNKKRMSQAQKLNLNQKEIISLAAIVHKESQHKPERKKIAGVYLNRIRIGMPLQADPTAIYAWKEKYGRELVIKRTLNKHKTFVSPFNTYTNRGIPPCSIAMPDIDAIDAVLNAERHSYLYFCASAKNIGTHNFAKNLSQHNRNANSYRRWLNQHRIYK